MSLDLDEAIYAIPEKRNGEMTGRVLVCPDRMRLLATACIPVVPGPCGCILGTEANWPEGDRRWQLAFEDVDLCECWNYITLPNYRWSIERRMVWGAYNGTWLMHAAFNCGWYAGDDWVHRKTGEYRQLLWAGFNCGDELYQDYGLTGIIPHFDAQCPYPGDEVTYRVECTAVNFVAEITVSAPRDCRQPLILQNQNTGVCGEGQSPYDPRPGFNGRAIIQVVNV